MTKCKICNEKIEEDSIGKLKGTIVKLKTDERNEFVYVCSFCQKGKSSSELKQLVAK